jgi:hypothetical protein
MLSFLLFKVRRSKVGFLSSLMMGNFEQCDEFRGEAYQIEDQSELEESFPYGEQLDSNTFACNVHPNCRCIVERQE